MNPNLLSMLVDSTLAASLAILLIAIARKPLQYFAGAQRAYWLWWLLPISQIVLVLPPSLRPGLTPDLLTPFNTAAATGTAHYTLGTPGTPELLPAAVGTILDSPAIMWLWLGGALLMFCVIAARQFVFVYSLAARRGQDDAMYRSPVLAAPVLVGLFRPRIVLPVDFEQRYGPEERAWILSHEQAHARRKDIRTNTLACLWLCVAWFNPFAHWAVSRMRRDQELACDAEVIRRTPGFKPAVYARALLTAQQATDPSRAPAPLVCAWWSRHPLHERIAMLKRKPRTGLWYLAGVLLTFAFLAYASLGLMAVSPSWSQPGYGSHSTFRTPLTRAELEALMRRPPIDDQRIPINSVEELMQHASTWSTDGEFIGVTSPNRLRFPAGIRLITTFRTSALGTNHTISARGFSLQVPSGEHGYIFLAPDDSAWFNVTQIQQAR